MARSTPTYTPVRNYAIGFSLSALLLFSDISYGAFAPLRGFVNASTIYAKMISNGIFENIGETFSSFQRNKIILQENKELKEKILQIRTKDFIHRKDNEEKIQIINFHTGLIDSLKNNDIDIFIKGSLFYDLNMYYCFFKFIKNL